MSGLDTATTRWIRRIEALVADPEEWQRLVLEWAAEDQDRIVAQLWRLRRQRERIERRLHLRNLVRRLAEKRGLRPDRVQRLDELSPQLRALYRALLVMEDAPRFVLGLPAVEVAVDETWR